MSKIKIIAPIKKPDDISFLAKRTECREFYVYYKKFLGGNYDYIKDFIRIAKENNCAIYINFKHDITEENVPEIKKMLKFLKNTEIDGIFVNCYAILEAIKSMKIPFKVIVDSYFDIHNISGINFINHFHKVDEVLITEEIYLKNIMVIKEHTKLPLAIDSDNLPYFAEEIEKLDVIDNVIIKGKFKDVDEIFASIKLIQKILKEPNSYKNKILPFKHVRKSKYSTNHFIGMVVSANGSNFKFSKNIKHFKWKLERTKRNKNFDFSKKDKYRINLRLSELSHLKELKKYIKKHGVNPIYSIEYGELVSTTDLAKRDYRKIIKKVKEFCQEYGIKFQLSTPKILIERDFDRVYEYEKEILLSDPKPDSLIVNNVGYFWKVINDPDIKDIPVELGQGINLLNSLSVKCLNNISSIQTVDFSSFDDRQNAIKTIKKIKKYIPNRKYTIAGNIKVPSMGLCPLNSDSAVLSRISCKAPCRSGGYALYDPSLDKVFPFKCDGFCRMHMFEDEILEQFDEVEKFYDLGVNEFVFDISALDPKFIPLLLDKFFKVD